ncbi:DUF3954 domain-containing protein [Ornithinibacillus xuwenensis]|uniref:DUF3954 domain-containing protein n=1 Tax=Ornithinibacillus xuwenensis TaxID=3144668 RepID=A0ABU9XD36_9BACI
MEKTAEIKLDQDAVFIVKKGQLKKINAPDSGFGEQTITWQDGKIHAEKVSYTVK